MEDEEGEHSRGREGSPNNTAGADDFDELHTMDMDGESAEAVKSVTEKFESVAMGAVGAVATVTLTGPMPLQIHQHLLPPHAVAAPSPLAAAIAAAAVPQHVAMPPPAFTGPSPVIGMGGLSAFQRPAQGVSVAPRLPVPA